MQGAYYSGFAMRNWKYDAGKDTDDILPQSLLRSLCCEAWTREGKAWDWEDQEGTVATANLLLYMRQFTAHPRGLAVRTEVVYLSRKKWGVCS